MGLETQGDHITCRKPDELKRKLADQLEKEESCIKGRGSRKGRDLHPLAAICIVPGA